MKKQVINKKQTASVSSNSDDPILVGQDKCRELIFPCPEDRPCHRTFTQWRIDGFFPSVKIGRRIYLDPLVVRKALTKRFTIQPVD